MESHAMTDRILPWRAPLTLILVLASVVFLALGLRTFFFPVAASAFYGAPAQTPEALIFVKAYGARNIALSLLALTLIRLDHWLGVVALLALVAGVAGLDALIMHQHAGFAGAAKHLLYVAGLSSLAAGAWLVGQRNHRRRQLNQTENRAR